VDDREIPERIVASDQGNVRAAVVAFFAIPAFFGLLVMGFGTVGLIWDLFDADDWDTFLLELFVLSVGGIVFAVCLGVILLAITPKEQ
jgi:hypothetical protein